MAWPITYVAHPEGRRAVGDLWPDPGFPSDWLGPAYKAKLLLHPHYRPPLQVMLPGRHAFCVDSCPTDQPANSWTVSIEGDLVDGHGVRLTVTPSIHIPGAYHGYVTGGMITDDLDGRLFDIDGHPLT